MRLNIALLKGSLVLLIAFNLFNFLNFIFHFSMARLLSVAEFGVLSALYTIIYVLSGFSETIQIIMTKYATKENNDGKVKNVLKRGLRKSFFVSIILFLVYLVVALVISQVAEIDYYLVSLTGLVIFFIFTTPITRGVLQGKKKFYSLGANMISESTVKVILAVGLVFIGWQVFGAIIATLAGSFVALIFSIFLLRKVFRKKELKTDVKEIYDYSIPSLFIVLGILVFYSIDVFIARIVFSPEIAGAYAIASILAKTIFLGTQPIGKAMFPISAEDKDKNKSNNTFLNSFVLLLIMMIGALIVFYFFSDWIVFIFSGKMIPEAASILFLLAIAIVILSFTNLLLLYKLSRGKVRNYFMIGIAILIEVFLLVKFSDNLIQFSIALIVASAAFLWASIFLTGD